jgi:hypothetical protein
VLSSKKDLERSVQFMRSAVFAIQKEYAHRTAKVSAHSILACISNDLTKLTLQSEQNAGAPQLSDHAAFLEQLSRADQQTSFDEGDFDDSILLQ